MCIVFDIASVYILHLYIVVHTLWRRINFYFLGSHIVNIVQSKRCLLAITCDIYIYLGSFNSRFLCSLFQRLHFYFTCATIILCFYHAVHYLASFIYLFLHFFFFFCFFLFLPFSSSRFLSTCIPRTRVFVKRLTKTTTVVQRGFAYIYIYNLFAYVGACVCVKCIYV